MWVSVLPVPLCLSVSRIEAFTPMKGTFLSGDIIHFATTMGPVGTPHIGRRAGRGNSYYLVRGDYHEEGESREKDPGLQDVTGVSLGVSMPSDSLT